MATQPSAAARTAPPAQLDVQELYVEEESDDGFEYNAVELGMICLTISVIAR